MGHPNRRRCPVPLGLVVASVGALISCAHNRAPFTDASSPTPTPSTATGVAVDDEPALPAVPPTWSSLWNSKGWYELPGEERRQALLKLRRKAFDCAKENVRMVLPRDAETKFNTYSEELLDSALGRDNTVDCRGFVDVRGRDGRLVRHTWCVQLRPFDRTFQFDQLYLRVDDPNGTVVNIGSPTKHLVPRLYDRKRKDPEPSR